jgi:protein-disulfide isomerase
MGYAASLPPKLVLEPNNDYGNVPQGRTVDGAFILGDPDAPITIIAFEDFLCPHCQEYEETTLSRFITEQVLTGHARFEYRFMPAIDPTYSFLVANMVECSATLQSGSFWAAHDIMFQLATQRRFGADTSTLFADAMGFDETALLDCATSGDHQIDVDSAYGEDLGVRGTPTIFVRYGEGEPELLSPTPFYEELVALLEQGKQ